jgi:uncharacterized membrane protein
MNKMLVAIFDTEPAAYEGLHALEDLHTAGDITLYATAVIAKDAKGAVSLKRAPDNGPLGTGLGLFTGSLLGVIGGPIGVALGAATGGTAGFAFDLVNTGISADFVDEVARTLTAGKVAVLAEVDETWVTPVDTRLSKLGAAVIRRGRWEFVNDQLAREAAYWNAELMQLDAELEHASAEHRAALQARMDGVRQKLAAIEAQAEAQANQARREAEAKLDTLNGQMTQAAAQQKAALEKRNAEMKAEYEARSAKLDQAQKLIKEALGPKQPA